MEPHAESVVVFMIRTAVFSLRPAIAAIGLFLSCLVPSSIGAQQSLQDALRDFRIGEFWLYDDWEAARKLSLEEKRPIFCVFRCVP